MKDYTLHIPEGVKDYTGEEATLKENIQNKVKQFFKGYSYDLIETPTFEYLDVFTAGEEGFQRPTLYNLVSRQGEVMALRSDMTRAIARVVCTQTGNLPMPQRFAYVANSFRYPQRYQGKLHEFTQAGIELIGKNTAYSDVEVIKVAIGALKAAGLNDFTVHIGNSQFLEYTLSDLGLNEEEKLTIYEAIEQKNAVKLKGVLTKASIEKETLELILELIQCAGKIDLLRRIKEKMTCPYTAKALEDLAFLYDLLEEEGVSDYVLFDFSLLSYGKYYTGVMFQIFTSDIGSAIVEGGRYDHLLGTFGEALPAVGFGMDVNLVLQKLLKGEVKVNKKQNRTLIVMDQEARAAGIRVSDALRSEGLILENSLSTTIEDAIVYAKSVGMGGLLHFKANGKVDVHNLGNGTVEEKLIDTL